MNQQTAKVKVIRGFITKPDEIVSPGDILTLPLSVARERVAAGQAEFVPVGPVNYVSPAAANQVDASLSSDARTSKSKEK